MPNQLNLYVGTFAGDILMITFKEKLEEDEKKNSNQNSFFEIESIKMFSKAIDKKMDIYNNLLQATHLNFDK